MKAHIDQLVKLRDGTYGIVVDTTKWAGYRYTVIRTRSDGKGLYGPAIKVRSWDIVEAFPGSRPTAGRVYRVNSAKRDRRCRCQCCPHSRDRREPRDEPEGTVLVDYTGLIRPLVERGQRIEMTLISDGPKGETRDLLAVGVITSASREGIALDLYES